MKKKKIKKKKMTLDELCEKGKELNEIHRWLKEEGAVGEGFYAFNCDIYNVIKDCKNKSAFKRYNSADNNLHIAIKRFNKAALNIMEIVESEYADMEDELIEEEDV